MEQQVEGVVPEVQSEEAPVVTVDRISGEPEIIPEKFKGKSIDDFMKSYNAMESEYSKTKNKIGELETKAQEAERLRQENEQLRLYQQQNQQLFQAQQQQAPVQQVNAFDELWEKDPGEAVKQSIAAIYQDVNGKLKAKEVESHYAYMKQNIPDFADLEPVMTNIAQRNAQHMDPNFRNSPDALNLLYLAAKGLKADETAKMAAQKGMQEAHRIQNEKFASMSEGPSSPAPAQDFSKLSLAEQRQYLIDHKLVQPGT